MMGELEILSSLHLRFTINNWDNVTPGFRKNSVFQFNGVKYILQYFYEYDADRTEYHCLQVLKEYGNCRHSIYASVQVESGGRGRIVTDLYDCTHLINVTTSWIKVIWEKEDTRIQDSIPDFRNHAMTWIIVLKEGISQAAAASAASQTKCSIPEGFEVSCIENLSADFARLMARDSDHDVVFKCEEKSIGAHEAVVCARSSVIAAMLRSDMVEGRTRVITIPDIAPDAFKHFLRYLYCGKLDELTCDIALTLYELGDQYAVLGLANRCSQFLLENLSPDNACDVLVTADLHSDRDFVENIITYMVEATVSYASDRWSAFRENHPKLTLRVLREKELVQEKRRRCAKRKFSFPWYICKHRKYGLVPLGHL